MPPNTKRPEEPGHSTSAQPHRREVSISRGKTDLPARIVTASQPATLARRLPTAVLLREVLKELGHGL
jgi:hypothetical protein